MSDTDQTELTTDTPPVINTADIIAELTERPHDIKKQKKLFADLSEATRDLIPNCDFITDLIKIMGDPNIDRNLLDTQKPLIKQLIDRRLQKENATFIEMSVPLAMSENLYCFEGYPERSVAAYCMDLFEDTLHKSPANIAFYRTCELLEKDIASPALKAKFIALHQATISRFLEENQADAIKEIIRTYDNNTIEQYIMPIIQDNETAGGHLLILTQALNIHSPVLAETFGDAAQIVGASNDDTHIKKTLELIQSLKKKVSRLETELAKTRRTLQETSANLPTSGLHANPETLMANFINALDNTAKKRNDPPQSSATPHRAHMPKVV